MVLFGSSFCDFLRAFTYKCFVNVSILFHTRVSADFAKRDGGGSVVVVVVANARLGEYGCYYSVRTRMGFGVNYVRSGEFWCQTRARAPEWDTCETCRPCGWRANVRDSRCACVCVCVSLLVCVSKHHVWFMLAQGGITHYTLGDDSAAERCTRSRVRQQSIQELSLVIWFPAKCYVICIIRHTHTCAHLPPV